MQNVALGLPAISCMPSLLLSCKKEELFDDSSFSGSVAIVGAGAAGMYAAYLLNGQNVKVKIYEASDNYGGRIRPLKNFSDFTIELGAEEIRGNNSLWYDLIASTNAEFVTAGLTDFYFVDSLLKPEGEMTGDGDFLHLREIVDNLANYSGADINAQIYGNIAGIAGRIEPIYNAWVGNDYGTSNARVGMAGIQESKNLWASGNNKYRLLHRDLFSIIEERFSSILGQIHLNTPIVSIDYSSSKIKLMSEGSEKFEADRVIVTVPLRILFDNVIDFIPNLPPLHLQSLSNIGMDKGIKIILRFSSRFWNDNTYRIYGSSLVPLFWAPGSGGKSSANDVLTAFVMGEKAEQLDSLGDTMITTILAELDQIFGNNVASSTLVGHHIMNWGDDPYIRGAYSYPKPGTGNARALLAEPISDKVFFAGEATHTGGHFGTVQGAMESALRAVSQVLKT